MTKIAYNADFGGFTLSDDAITLGRALTGDPEWDHHFLPRHDAVLVQVIEALGLDKAGGDYSELCLREVPPGTLYRIEEYDGSERVILASEQKWITAD